MGFLTGVKPAFMVRRTRSTLFSLQAVEHLERGIKYPDIPMHTATWKSTHRNKCYVLSAKDSLHPWEMRNSFSEPRWWNSWYTHSNTILHPVPTGSLEALTLCCLFLHSPVKHQITTNMKKVIVWEKVIFVSFFLKIWDSYLAWAT